MALQEIIVYRNPAEAAIWHALTNEGGFEVFGAVIALGMLWAAIHVACDKLYVSRFFRKSWQRRGMQCEWSPYVASLVIVAIVAAWFIL